MSVKESKVAMDKDYEKLAQLFTLIRLKEYSTLQRNLQNININYQIPDNEYFKLNNPEYIGYTALHFAVGIDKEEDVILKMLLKFGADFTIKNKNGETVLHQATERILQNLDSYWGKVEEDERWALVDPDSPDCLINLLLSSHTISKNITNPFNKYGISHFHIACLMNNIEVVQLFLKSGVSINQAVHFDSPFVPGYTPLHFAVRYFSIETLKILIGAGADTSLKDARMMSPLHLLIKRNIEIVDYERTNFEDEFEINKKMINLLIAKESFKDCNIKDDIGLSYFHAVCTLQDVALVIEIFKQVSNLNQSIHKDSLLWPGYTALHFAAHFDFETFYFLIKRGADMLIKDCYGVTPIDICTQKYDISRMYSIVDSQPQWHNIFFSNNQIKLSDMINSMKTVNEFESFSSNITDINMFIPCTSLLWPGCTPLHLAVTFCTSSKYFNFYEDTQVRHGNQSMMYNEKELGIVIIEICLRLGADVTVQDVHGSTPVHLAFYKNRMDIAHLLLQKQMKICNPVDHIGLSHLHIACVTTTEMRNYEYVSKLLPSNTDSNVLLRSKLVVPYIRYSYGSITIIYGDEDSTPMHFAVAAGNTELVEILLKSGFDINAKSSNGYTPIHHLLTHRVNLSDVRENTHKLLLLCDLKNIESDCGLNHLHIACFLENVEAVKKLLDCGANVNATIHSISNSNFLESPNRKQKELLLAHQKSKHRSERNRKYIDSLMFVHRYKHYTPLHFALKYYFINEYESINYEVVEVLLHRGANILAKKENNSVILYKVLATRNTRLTEMFIKQLEHNCEWRKFIEKDSGITMLHIACFLFDLDTVAKLLKNGAYANAICHSDSQVWSGCTPLHVLMIFIQKESYWTTYEESLRNKVCAIIKLLFDHGADIMIQNSYHKTPLHQSIEKFTFNDDSREKLLPYDEKKLQFTKLLLKYHKDFNRNPTDDRGISHFHIACLCNDINTVSSFLKHDVDFNAAIDSCIKDYGGYTPLHIAVIHKFEEIIHLLVQHEVNVNAKDCLMETPLHIAFSLKTEFGLDLSKNKYVNILLNAGARTTERNIFGHSPFEKFLIEIKKDSFSDFVEEDVVNFIISYGICINAFYPSNQAGFIGLNLCNFESYETFLQNPIYQALINMPELNDEDFFGRNVIHNIVSTSGWRENKLETDDYIQIIGKLIGQGFDIDHQDKQGFTPLHLATRFENVAAIESLFMYGADVNIVNANGRVPYSYSYIMQGYEEELELNTGLHHETFHKHFNKLLLFDLELSTLNEEMITKVHESYTYEFSEDNMRQNEYLVINETNRLQNVKIEPYSIKLHDFLSDTGIVSVFPFKMKCEREAIDKFFQEKFEYLRKNFPETTGILYLQYRKALARRALIEPAIISLNFVIDFELPLLCSEAILKFLNNVEMEQLIAAKDLV